MQQNFGFGLWNAVVLLLLNVDFKSSFFFLTSVYKYIYLPPMSIALLSNLLHGFCIHHLLLKQIIFEEEERYGKRAWSLYFCILFPKAKIISEIGPDE